MLLRRVPHRRADALTVVFGQNIGGIELISVGVRAASPARRKDVRAADDIQ
jgi:hypothetical protein